MCEMAKKGKVTKIRDYKVKFKYFTSINSEKKHNLFLSNIKCWHLGYNYAVYNNKKIVPS